jgi:16S rRNA (cytidine1402-2'-O)-methyltransferase
LASDAGTPLISDPGHRLVSLAIVNTIKVVSIPGPSALLTALTASGLPSSPFHFAGLLSAKRTQFRKELSELNELLQDCTLILYEAPHRILEALADVAEICGPDRPVVLARELTKVHEEFLRGTALSIQTQLAARPSIKGEITLLIGPAPAKPPEEVAPATLREEVAALVSQGTPRMDAIKEVARRHHLPKRQVYKTASRPSP